MVAYARQFLLTLSWKACAASSTPSGAYSVPRVSFQGSVPPVTDERNKALGSTDDPGVAGHPGDEGMRQIADAILKAID